MKKYGAAAHFDCFSGVSGDMTLGALIDMGVPVQWLKDSLSGMDLPDFDIRVETVLKHGVAAKNVSVLYEPKDASHRHFKAIESLLMNGGLPEKTARLSRDIFKKIADAESRVHGCPIDEVHFHETGATDAIIDIVGSALCLSYTGIETVTASAIPLGRGEVECAHGILPIPAPATLEILKGIPVCHGGADHELTTPTGAAIIATIAESFGPMPPMTPRQIGYGAGDADIDGRPNLLRVIRGDATGRVCHDAVDVIETSIDDMNPEFYDLLMERLFSDGALDVCLIPAAMKKNRPGVILKALCRPQDKETVIRRILSETSSSGVRHYQADRTLLFRDATKVATDLGEIECKRIHTPDGGVRLTPEYESCKKIAAANDVPIHEVYEMASRQKR